MTGIAEPARLTDRAGMLSISSLEIGSVPVAELVVTASEMPMPDEAEIARLVGRFAHGHEDARVQLVRAYLRIAVDEAIRNRGLGVRQDLLVRAGSRALIEASVEYAPDRHGTFSRYAREVVRRAIRRELDSQGNPADIRQTTVGAPRHAPRQPDVPR